MQMYTGYWVALPQEVRAKLKEYFNIQRSGGSHVENGRIVSDGHTDQDLKAITLEKMQTLLGSEEKDFMKLLETTIQHFTDEVEQEKTGKVKAEQEQFEAVKEEEVKAAEELIEKVATEVVKRRGRKTKVK
jgi:hypothetical protein